MGKGELWDDSALLNAFDDAMSKYKKMHGKKTADNSTDEEKVSPFIANESHTVSYAEENSNVTSNTSTNFVETTNLSPVQEDHEPCVDSSIGQHDQTVNDYSYSQNPESYNQLLTQYYDLEEKRQSILNQLQQFGSYDYQQPSVESQQLGTCWNHQDHLVSKTLVCSSCCPYSFPSCSLCCSCSCKMCANSSISDSHSKSALSVDGDIVKTAMGATEKAISSMKAIASTNSSAEEKEKGKDNVEEFAQSMTVETDLSAVLNAWYSAGFYTGKYLTEQSIVKKSSDGEEKILQRKPGFENV